MRIIGGKYRGKKLISPDSAAVRPTSDRAREALFNILRSRLNVPFAELSLLDVFCGSGAFALEALSQGFAKAGAVDIDIRPLLKNLALFPAEKDKLKIYRQPAATLKNPGDAYDVLFMDAPYNQGLTEPALQAIASARMLKPSAWCLIELRNDEILNLPPQYQYIEERRYGLAKVVIARFDYQGS